MWLLKLMRAIFAFFFRGGGAHVYRWYAVIDTNGNAVVDASGNAVIVWR